MHPTKMSDPLKVFSLNFFSYGKAAFRQTYNKEGHKTRHAIRRATKKGRMGLAEDSQSKEQESYALEESEQQEEDKDED